MSAFVRRLSTFAWLGVWLALGCSRDGQSPQATSSQPGGGEAVPAAARPSAAPSLEAGDARRGVVPGRDVILGPGRLLTGERLSLLVMLHGLGGSGDSAARALELAAFSERERVLVLAPDGPRDSLGRRFWNAHPACCDFEASGADHVQLLAERIDAVVQSSPVDERRVFVAGFSNGGFMALKLACRLGARVRAVASIAGAGPGPEATACATQLPHVLLVHGDRDTTVRYEGGSVFDDPALPRHASAVETFHEWAARASCQGATQAEPFDALSSISGAETIPLRAKGCRAGGVLLWTVRGGTHAIGGSVSLFERVWEFFEKHAEPG